MWVAKKKQLSKLFAVNSIVCSVAFHALWQVWFINYHDRYYESWTFKLENEVYEIAIEKKSNHFWLSDITNAENGSTTGLNFGEYYTKGDSIILIDQSDELYVKQRMTIHENKLYGYNRMEEIIELNK